MDGWCPKCPLNSPTQQSQCCGFIYGVDPSQFGIFLFLLPSTSLNFTVLFSKSCLLMMHDSLSFIILIYWQNSIRTYTFHCGCAQVRHPGASWTDHNPTVHLYGVQAMFSSTIFWRNQFFPVRFLHFSSFTSIYSNWEYGTIVWIILGLVFSDTSLCLIFSSSFFAILLSLCLFFF